MVKIQEIDKAILEFPTNEAAIDYIKSNNLQNYSISNETEQYLIFGEHY